MSSRFLQVFVDNASFVIAGTLPLMTTRRAGLKDVLEICTQFRRRGIAAYLHSGSSGLLLQDLQRSGAAFAAYLEWATEPGKVASKSVPFHDAVAAGDLAAATTIAQLDSTTLQPDYEYEDDFLYMRILYGRFFLGANPSELAAMLKRYEVLLDGADDPRFLICRAFLDTRPDQFEIALEQLIAAREDAYAAGVDADDILEEEWATEGRVFVEGMALLRLARVVGFAVQQNYLFIPSTAMRASVNRFDPGSWMTA